MLDVKAQQRKLILLQFPAQLHEAVASENSQLVRLLKAKATRIARAFIDRTTPTNKPQTTLYL